MNVGGGEAADQLVRMMLSGTEVIIRLSGSAAKNLLALTLALAKDHKKLYGKISMNKMLSQTRDLRTFPMTPEQFKAFKKEARKQHLLYSFIRDKDDKGKLIDVVLPVTELERANMIFERILQPGEEPGQPAPEREEQQRERSAEAHEDRDGHRQERGDEAPESRDRQRQRPRRRNQPENRVDPESAERKRDADVDKVTLSKKGSRSERGSPDSKTSSSSPKDKTSLTTSERPSVEARLKGFQEQISKGKDAPIKMKTKSEPVK